METAGPQSHSTNPASEVVYNAVEGKPATLYVQIGGGTPPFTFQWAKDGLPIQGATEPVLSLGPLRTSHSGDYTITVTNAYGSDTSPVETLRVRPLRPSRLSNVSILAATEPALVVGFALDGDTTGPASLLARAAGPALTQFGVVGTIADPKLELLSEQTVVAANDDWFGDAALDGAIASVGAFPFPPSSKDSALTLTLPAANYTARVTAANEVTGVASMELYELAAAAGEKRPRLVNISAQALTGDGRATLLAGFTIQGEAPLTVLLRGVGPGLAQLGVGGVLARPRLRLFQGGTRLATNENWRENASALRDAARTVGAFALPADSRDAAMLQTLSPGSYTVEVDSADGASGVVLVELYEIPRTNP